MRSLVEAFLKGHVTYRHLYYELLTRLGATLSLRRTRKILERVGVEPGAFVVGRGLVPDRGPGFPREVFYVRDLVVSYTYNRVVLLTEYSFPSSVQEALRRGEYFPGCPYAGIFVFFEPDRFEIVGHAPPSLVGLAISLGTYNELVKQVRERFNV